MRLYGSLWNLIGPYASLWVPMGIFRSLCDVMDCNGSFWVFLGPYSSLWILMGCYGSLFGSSFRPIATVAAMLLFCLATGRTQKAFQFPLSTWPVG